MFFTEMVFPGLGSSAGPYTAFGFCVCLVLEWFLSLCPLWYCLVFYGIAISTADRPFCLTFPSVWVCLTFSHGKIQVFAFWI